MHIVYHATQSLNAEFFFLHGGLDLSLHFWTLHTR